MNSLYDTNLWTATLLTTLGAALGSSAKPLMALVLAVSPGSDAPIDAHQPQPVFVGTVISVSHEAIAIHEKTTSTDVAFQVAPYAAVEKDGHLAQIGDIRPGDLARVTTDTDGRGYKAVAVDAETPPKQ